MISIDDARKIAVKAQLLADKLYSGTKKDLYKIIEHLGYIQIDTISIVERAHKHILWARIPSFRNEMLDELIDKDKKVFEFWDHAASFLPMKHYRYTLPRKEMYAKKYSGWEKKNKKLLKFILDRITAEGPLQSRDFEDTKKRGEWWDWKPAKDGLEFLFHTGRLAVKARKSFQKVYDLTERTLPAGIDTSMPSGEELSEHIILKALKANGISSEKELTYLRHHNRKATKDTINKLLEQKKIGQVTIGGADEVYYTLQKKFDILNKEKSKDVIILSPFDNLVIQRKRLNTIFSFDYTIECYLPAPKRKFGYFCLPVLYGDKLVGRIDAKADRASDTFIVINEYWETGNKLTDEFKQKYYNSLKELALFAGCSKISFKA